MDLYAAIRPREVCPPAGQARGWLQWKGTDACMDFHCKCGYFGHIDGLFVFYVRCPKCHTTYSCNPNIHMTELTAEEAAEVERGPIIATVPT